MGGYREHEHWKPDTPTPFEKTLAVQSEELGDGDLTNTGGSGHDEKDEDDLEEVMRQKLHIREFWKYVS